MRLTTVFVCLAVFAAVWCAPAWAGFGPQVRWSAGVRDMVVAPDGSVYVLDGRGLAHYTADGALLFERADARLGRARSIAISPSGARLYVTEPDDDAVDVLSPADGQVVQSWSTPGPRAVAVAADGSVYVGPGRLKHFTADGAPLPAAGFEDGDFLSIDSAGFLYDTGTNAPGVEQRDPRTGKIPLVFPRYEGPGGFLGAGSSQYGGPGDTAITSDGRLWVADRLRAVFESFTPSGVFAQHCEVIARVLAAGQNGVLFVADPEGVTRYGPVVGAGSCPVAPRVDRLRVRYDARRGKLYGAITMSEAAQLTIHFRRYILDSNTGYNTVSRDTVSVRRSARPGRNTFGIKHKLRAGSYEVTVVPVTRDQRPGSHVNNIFVARRR